MRKERLGLYHKKESGKEIEQHFRSCTVIGLRQP